MPNVGRRSLACVSCRRMKVKCDELRPTCSRCVKGKRQCIWPEEPCKFHSMNDVSEQRALQDLRPRGSHTARKTGTSSGGGGESHSAEPSYGPRPADASGAAVIGSDVAIPAILNPPDPTPQLATDWSEHALAYYVAEYTLPPNVLIGTDGYMDALPELLAEAPERGFLREAARAVAYAALGNRLGYDELGTEGRKSLARSIPGLRESLARGEIGDDVLVGTFLLSQYHLIAADETPSSPLWQSHAAAQAAILASRGPAQFSTGRGRSLFGSVFLSLQLRGPTTTTKTTRRGGGNNNDSDDGSGSSHLAGIDVPVDVCLCRWGRYYARVTTRAAALAQRAFDLVGDTNCNSGNGNVGGNTAHLEGKSVDWWTEVRATAEAAWAAVCEADVAQSRGEIPSEFQHREVPVPGRAGAATSAGEGGGEGGIGAAGEAALPAKIFVYPTLRRAAVWISLWVRYAKLVEALRALCAALASPASPFPWPPAGAVPNVDDDAALAARLRALTQQILASLPYLLCEVDAAGRPVVPRGRGKCLGPYFALWPMYALAGIGVLTGPERDWVLGKLDGVGKVWGIRQAEVLAEWSRKQV